MKHRSQKPRYKKSGNPITISPFRNAHIKKYNPNSEMKTYYFNDKKKTVITSNKTREYLLIKLCIKEIQVQPTV